jgi:hypothetical protein
VGAGVVLAFGIGGIFVITAATYGLVALLAIFGLPEPKATVATAQGK